MAVADKIVVGSVMVTKALISQSFASLMVIVWIPAIKSEAVALVDELLSQVNLYGVVPPETVTVATPSEPPLHFTGLF